MPDFLLLGKEMVSLANSQVIPLMIFLASVTHARKSLDRGRIFTCTGQLQNCNLLFSDEFCV